MKLQQTDHRIDSAEPGCKVMLRNKHIAGRENFGPERTLFFVHGATYASSLTFDYAIDGESWMDQLAKAGFDTWCLDLVGYGESDRPPAMNEPAENHPPICDTRLAVQDVGRAFAFIMAQRGIDKLNLIGYSWGTAIAGSYAGEHASTVNRLVLYGALWVKAGANSRLAPATPGAYRTVDVEAAISRWAQGFDEAGIEAIVPESTRRQWCEAAIASDPNAGEFDPPQLRAPTGVMKDFIHCASTGESWYEPGKIEAPTLIVVGEWDKETTPEQCRTVFDQLTNAARKRLTVIGGGTHSLLLENARHELHQVVSDFLMA